MPSAQILHFTRNPALYRLPERCVELVVFSLQRSIVSQQFAELCVEMLVVIGKCPDRVFSERQDFLEMLEVQVFVMPELIHKPAGPVPI